MKTPRCAALLLASLFLLGAATGAEPAGDAVAVRAPLVALIHARVVDGLGHAPLADQTLILRAGKIAALGATAETQIPEGATVLDLTGKTVLPGFVLAHEHLFYSSITKGPFHLNEMEYSFPRLYLAAGVTSARTTGCIEPDTDLEVKKQIEGGKLVGPKLHLTAPYFDGPGTGILQARDVGTAADAVRKVNFWLFVHMGLLTGVAAAVFSGRSNGAQPNMGNSFELDVIAACFIGGASTTGGIGRVTGALVGGLVMAVMSNGMSLMGVPQSLQPIVKGLVPSDGFGSTALVSQTKMLDAAGKNIFDWEFASLYGLNTDQLVIWNSFLSGQATAAQLTAQMQAISDKAAASK